MPARLEMLAHAVRVAGVVQYDLRRVAFRRQHEPHHRIDPVVPCARPSCLDEPRARHALDVPAVDHAAEERELTSGRRIDLRRGAGHRAELRCLRQRRVDRVRRCREGLLLVDVRGHDVSLKLVVAPRRGAAVPKAKDNHMV